MTTTLFKIIQSELQKKGFDEFIDSNGQLVLFDSDHQFMTKIIKYDDDVSEIVNKFFNNETLQTTESDQHFKKAFTLRFLNREINRQTVESFKIELLLTFMIDKELLNSMYGDIEKYINNVQTNETINTQTNEQTNNNVSTTDNRQAYAQLPQDNVQLDLKSTIMEHANDNTISRNKQTNEQTDSGETKNDSLTENKTFSIDELIRGNGLLEEILNHFDKKCFIQIW